MSSTTTDTVHTTDNPDSTDGGQTTPQSVPWQDGLKRGEPSDNEDK